MVLVMPVGYEKYYKCVRYVRNKFGIHVSFYTVVALDAFEGAL